MNESSQNKKQSPSNIYAVCAAAITILSAISGVISVFAFYTSGERYFNSTVPSYIMLASSLLAVILALRIIIKPKCTVISEVRSDSSNAIMLLPAAPALICFFGAASSDTAIALKIALCACSFFVAAYHVSASLKLSKSVTLVLSYLKVIFCILIVTSLHIDLSIESNSPFKLLIQFAAISVMVSTLADAKKLLSKATVRYFTVAKIISASLCMLAGSTILSVFLTESKALGEEYLCYSLFLISDSLLSVCLLARTSIPDETTI